MSNSPIDKWRFPDAPTQYRDYVYHGKHGDTTLVRIGGAVDVRWEGGKPYAFGGVGVPAFPAAQPNPQAFKADDGKPRWDLLMSAKGMARTLAGVVRVLSFAVRPKEQGGKGYIDHSWREVPEAKRRYEAAFFRHYEAVQRGEQLDPESGESHWYHMACCILFRAELEDIK